MLIRNLENSRGKTVPNQFVLETKSKLFFQSYETVVALYNTETKKLYVTKDWNYSSTTTRHFLHFVRTECLPFAKDFIEMYGEINSYNFKKAVSHGFVKLLAELSY